MFGRVRTNDERKTMDVQIDGISVSCFEGDTVAAVVMLHGDQPYRRNVVSGGARMPFCMMGVCFECLVEINGTPNQQGCLRNVEPGMRIQRQISIRNIAIAEANET